MGDREGDLEGGFLGDDFLGGEGGLDLGGDFLGGDLGGVFLGGEISLRNFLHSFSFSIYVFDSLPSLLYLEIFLVFGNDFFILVLSLGAIYFIFRIFKIENYDWLYAIPIGLHFLFPSLFNTENDENSESDNS